MSCGVNGATPAAARSRRITAPRSSASRSLLTRSPRTASTYNLRRKRCWTGIEASTIGCVSIAGNDLLGLALKLLPILCLAIAVAYHEDAPLRREIGFARLKATDHRRRNIGVAAEHRLV